jgi:hypothetical protein
VVVARGKVAEPNMSTQVPMRWEASTEGDLRDIYTSHNDRRCFYELSSVKKIVLSGLEVEIINKYVFTLHPGRIY